ncbi:MAG: S41 family peptidase [Deltaproteobacteria bacterium]|jgi:carboxyl-terminal processing protease|nr:S41 family peptidase [Deltaproteobacteria bacterium]
MLPRLFLGGLVLFALFSAADCPAASNYDYSHLKRFSEVLDMVHKDYVREVGNDELVEGALKGMLQALDPHSAFLTPEEFSEMRDATSGEFTGVGIEISSENGKIVVVTPIDDTPAKAAGVLAGDVILAVDGKPTMEMNQNEVVGLIRGPKGTQVELLILHKNAVAPVSLKIERDFIPLISVRGRFLEEGFLWLRLSRFSEKTSDELEKALADARKKTPLKGIVLDLRNNPGGLLDQAVRVSDVFLQDGLIVYMKGRNANAQREFFARRSSRDVTEPIAVLINSGSASAAEIVAGALQDRKRAVLIGERSFGKGSVQEVKPLGSFAVKLTTALYYTPDGRSIQAEGIEPDLSIPFEMPRENEGTDRFLRVREQDLSRHLENEAAPEGGREGGVAFVADQDAAHMLDRDNQLRMALQVVKSLPRIQELSWKQ